MSKAPRNYRKEYDEFHASAEQRLRRGQRNKARASAMKRGAVHKGDGKEVHHVSAPRKGSLAKTRTAVVSKAYNRARQPKRGG